MLKKGFVFLFLTYKYVNVDFRDEKVIENSNLYPSTTVLDGNNLKDAQF